MNAEATGPGAAEVVTDSASAVLVPVPEAERAVREHRARLDAAAALGVPAHVTVLYPFVPPPAITPSVLDALAGAVASVGAFGCEFGDTAWFGEDVLWLAPRPQAPFLALIRAVGEAFPGYRPYGGAHLDPIPHLTVGERPVGGVAELRAAEEAVRPQLPIRAQVSRVWLMTRLPSPGGWRTVAEFPLADLPLGAG
jgi:hypothetical protein